jgi:hypothetical protein
MEAVPDILAMKSLCLAPLLVIASASSAFAQLALEIKDGRVTLDARNVPARQILAEWARIGGTKIVNGEKVGGGPLTLKLVNMPERQALDIILKNVAGYMAAPRQASATPGSSTYDRIMILATTSAPAPAAANNGRGNTGPNVNTQTGPMGRRLPPRPPNLPPAVAENAEQPEPPEPQDDSADNGVQQPVFQFPSQPQNGNPNQVFVPMQNGSRPGTAPVITLQPNANGQPTVYTFVPNGEAPSTAPVGPSPVFGGVGAPSPGMIQQPPATPAQPQRPPK